jgi:hypothetical protein
VGEEEAGCQEGVRDFIKQQWEKKKPDAKKA